MKSPEWDPLIAKRIIYGALPSLPQVPREILKGAILELEVLSAESEASWHRKMSRLCRKDCPSIADLHDSEARRLIEWATSRRRKQ